MNRILSRVRTDRIRGALIWVVAMSGLAVCACTVDLRQGLGDTATPAQAKEAQRILVQTVQAHGGLEQWEKKKTTTTYVQDTWQGFFVNALANPWPTAVTLVTMDFVNGRMASRARFTAGKLKNVSWGRLHDGRTYVVDTAGGLKFKTMKDARFILAAIHYLNELPFRIKREATQVAYLGTQQIGSRTFHRVLATWGTDLKPSATHDQYVLYIDTKTKLLAKAAYTVRDFASFAQGCMHFDDYRKVDGLSFPFLQTVTSECEQPDYRKSYLHQIIVSKVQFDATPVERLNQPAP